MVARAVATECGLEFISVKGPELLDMYVGESERNVRAVFQSARSAAPCVLFFDEMDSLCPQRSKTSDGGSVMDRVVSQLLTEMDNLVCPPDDSGASGVSGNVRHVFVIGATNRPDLLDPALLRPGRFDKLIYMSVCDTMEQRMGILQAQTRKLRFATGDGGLVEVAKVMPSTITGADISSVVARAYSIALERTIATLEADAGSKNIRGNDEMTKYVESCAQAQLLVEVHGEDFTQALLRFKCSVSEADLLHYNSLHKMYCQKDSGNGSDSGSD